MCIPPLVHLPVIGIPPLGTILSYFAPFWPEALEFSELYPLVSLEQQGGNSPAKYHLSGNKGVLIIMLFD